MYRLGTNVYLQLSLSGTEVLAEFGKVRCAEVLGIL